MSDDPTVYNRYQTHVSHIKDGACGPFHPPQLDFTINIGDAATLMRGAKYIITLTPSNSEAMAIVPIFGVDKPLDVDLSDEAIIEHIAEMRNQERKRMETYAHLLYAPVVQALAEAHSVIRDLGNLLFGDKDGDVKDQDINVVLASLSAIEDRLDRLDANRKAYVDGSRFDKAAGDA